jgi:hypothetical protein
MGRKTNLIPDNRRPTTPQQHRLRTESGMVAKQRDGQRGSDDVRARRAICRIWSSIEGFQSVGAEVFLQD